MNVEQMFSPYAIRKNDYRNFDYYLENLETDEKTAELRGLIPDSTYFCLDEDRDIFVGAVNIRHYLNENLCHTGGHIGDGIRPSERRKGYATAMIGLALEKCREMGIHKVLMTCGVDNIGSAKSIIHHGGGVDYEVIEDGVPEQRYWITLSEEIIESERLFLKRRMPSDGEDAFAWASDARTMKYMMGNPCKAPSDLRPVFEKSDPNSKTRYIMIARSKEDGHAVGAIACNGKNERGGCELSWIVRYEDWNKGYCTEMALAMMDYLGKKYGVTDYWAESADENVASHMVMKKLGLVPVEKHSYSKRDNSVTFESTIYRKP